MCARFCKDGREFKPGDEVEVRCKHAGRKVPWAGFARNETLPWWQKNGGELVDIHAERFAERANDNHDLIWDDIPAGQVIRGLIEKEKGQLKIVTRPATDDETKKFRHSRMPLLEPPLW